MQGFLLQQFTHVICDGKRSRQAGGFEAKQLYKPCNAMVTRPLDDEVPILRARAGQCGPDARITWLQAVCFERWIIIPDCCRKNFKP